MKKFKKMVAGVLAAASLAVCMGTYANAETLTLRKGSPIADVRLNASCVMISGECSSSSESFVHFLLRYSSGWSFIDDQSYVLRQGQSFSNVVSSVVDPNTLWNYAIKPFNTNKLNGVATGTIEIIS